MGYPVFYVPFGDVLPVPFSSYAGATGASVTLTGLAVTDIEIYKDGSTTQRASDAGYVLLDTDGIDFDSITGIHGFSIDTGDNTDAGFYTIGAWFTVVVSAVTIDAQTVNFIAAMFRIMPAEAVAGKPKVDVDAWLGTAVATPTVAGVPEVDITHYAGSTTNVSTIPASISDILVDTGTTLQGELDGIQTDTEDIQTRLPAALVSGRIDASVGAMAANVLTATAIAADAITAAKVADGTIDANTFAAGAITATAIAADAIGSSELASTAITEIVDAIWNETIAGHNAAGSSGEALINAGAVGDPWATAIPGAYGAGTAGERLGDIFVNVADILVDTAVIGAAGAGLTALATQASVNTIDDFLDTEIAAVLAAVDTEVAAILADTNELQVDWVDGGRLDLILDARASQTSVNTIDDFLDTEIAAIKAKTDSLTFTTANQVDATTVTVSAAAIGAGDISSAALNEIADAVLDRNMATGTDSGSTTVRTPRQALRSARNRVAVVAGTATIYKEDDSTSSWTAAVTTAAGNPISEVDPAGP